MPSQELQRDDDDAQGKMAIENSIHFPQVKDAIYKLFQFTDL